VSPRAQLVGFTVYYDYDYVYVPSSDIIKITYLLTHLHTYHYFYYLRQDGYFSSA